VAKKGIIDTNIFKKLSVKENKGFKKNEHKKRIEKLFNISNISRNIVTHFIEKKKAA